MGVRVVDIPVCRLRTDQLAANSEVDLHPGVRRCHLGVPVS